MEEGLKDLKKSSDDNYPIARWDGESWERVSLYNKKHMQTAILVCGGPSFGDLEVEKLRGPGKVVLGMNNTYPVLKPDMWLGMDAPHCYDRHLLYEGFTKFMRAGYWDRYLQNRMLRDIPNINFISVQKPPEKRKHDWGYIFDQIHKDAGTFVWNKNSFAVALNLLLYMGFKDIVLAGVDFDNSKKDYYSDVVLNKEGRDSNSTLYFHLWKYTRFVVQQSKKKLGVRWRSLSPKSKINEYMPYVSLDHLNREVNMRLPQRGKLYNSVELDNLRDKKEKPRI